MARASEDEKPGAERGGVVVVAGVVGDAEGVDGVAGGDDGVDPEHPLFVLNPDRRRRCHGKEACHDRAS